MQHPAPAPNDGEPSPSPFPTAIVRCDGTVATWSRGALTLGQRLKGGLKALEHAIAKSVAPGTLETLAAPASFSCSLPQENGQPLALRIELAPAESGELWVRFIDDTDYAQVVRSERHSTSILDRLTEALPMAFFAKDPRDDYRITRMNRCFEETFGCNREEMIGRSDYDLFPEDLADGYREADKGVFARGERLVIEEEIETKRGRRAARTIKLPLFDEDGNPELLIAILEDVEDLHELIRAAEKASSLKSRFLANMSHEIRTPLYGVLGMIEAAIEVEDPLEHGSMLNTAKSCGTSLLAVINDILDLSQVEEGKLKTVEKPFTLSRLLSEVSSSMLGYAPQKGVRLNIVESGLDDSALQVMGDADRLKQVILNLVSNAIKHSPVHEEVSIQVEHRLLGESGRERDFIRISVIDQGSGISDDEQETIFAPFGQASDVGFSPIESTGLGLTIAKQLIELMGGRIGVMSSAGEGCTFWIELSLDVAAGTPENEGSPATPSAGEHVPLAPARILVAEDNPVNQKIVGRYLQREGHSVVFAGDGEAAVEAVLTSESGFDFVLMDIQMPQLDGFGAMRAIRAHEGNANGRLPIIALTANAMKGDDDLCMEAGADGYLPKPLSPEDLFRTMRLLDRRAA